MDNEVRAALRPTEVLLAKFLGAVPTLTAVVLILALGVAASLLVAKAVRWLLQKSRVEVLAERIGLPDLLYKVGVRSGVVLLLSRAVLVLGLLLTLVTAAETAGFAGLADELLSLVGLTPRLLLALAIVVGGIWVGSLVRGLVVQTARNHSSLESPELVARLVFYVIVVNALTLAASQLGIDTALVTSLLLVLFAALGLAFALAFGLASRVPLADILQRYYAARLFKPGDRIRVDDTIAGVVVRYGPTTVHLRRDGGGTLVVPCSELMRRPVQVDSSRQGAGGVGRRERGGAEEEP